MYERNEYRLSINQKKSRKKAQYNSFEVEIALTHKLSTIYADPEMPQFLQQTCTVTHFRIIKIIFAKLNW